MAKSPMDILDYQLTTIREHIQNNIVRKEELNNQIHELNLESIELEYKKLQFEDAMTTLKRNEVSK